jgi:hypothetical protein
MIADHRKRPMVCVWELYQQEFILVESTGQTVMCQIIEYYIPERFTPPKTQWMPEAEHGKLIGFQRKSVVKAEEQPVAAASRWMAFTPR